MSILNVENLSHGFGDRAIFNNVSFRLLKGEHIGLIGANGEGKSTFMNIITGRLQPDEGKVEWSKKVRVGYLDQHTALEKGRTIRQVLVSAFDFLLEMEQELNGIYEQMGEADEDTLQQLMEEAGTLQDLLTMHDFYMIDAKVEETGRALGLSHIGLDKDVSELSGGQRAKVLLARLLLEKPDILLLDEPTNYLDKEHIEWLKRYLNEYENAFILISHDIPFLNSVVNLIYHMDNQELNRYVGDYDRFREVYAMKKAQLEAAYNKQQKEIADLKDFVARNKARVATRNMAMSRQKKLDKMDVIELAAEKPKPAFHFKEARTPGRYIFQTKDLVIGYEEPLSSPLNLEMERNEKIVLTGANGIGKTTLLKSILGLTPPLSGTVEQGDYLEIGYFEQEMNPHGSATCIEEIWAEFPSYTQYEVRSALAKCGLTTRHIESLVKVLSGGEQAKVRLCKLINKASNLLALDEPTNHLDPDAKAELKRALQAYRGSILMVCHEPEFYEGLATQVWNCTEWTTKTV
ncbi:MAG: ATP-binding cassette domain-containing protein [Lachnospiraceae bacterium]|nr:ATP-binding cassette domain-containing protein [Lachnospiraceae bacterium]